MWKLLKKIWAWYQIPKRTNEAETKLKELLVIEKELNLKIKTLQPIFTTIRSFAGMNTEYYGWVTRMLDSPEYKFMCFDLRENIIRGMVNQNDEKELIRSAGRLDMINVIGNYLLRYKVDYEKEVRGNTK